MWSIPLPVSSPLGLAPLPRGWPGTKSQLSNHELGLSGDQHPHTHILLPMVHLLSVTKIFWKFQGFLMFCARNQKQTRYILYCATLTSESVQGACPFLFPSPSCGHLSHCPIALLCWLQPLELAHLRMPACWFLRNAAVVSKAALKAQ